MPNYTQELGLLEQALIPKFMSVASLTLLVYDNILTLDREISSIWHQKWNFGKLLFLVNRYLPVVVGVGSMLAEILPTPSDSFCRPWYYFETYTGIIMLIVAQIIMTLRTYAMYKKNRAVLMLLSFLTFSAAVIMIVIAVLFTPRLFYQVNPLPSLVGKNHVVGLGCLKDCSGHCTNLLRAFWLTPMIFDGVVFLLTIVSATQYSRTEMRVPLLFVLFRDGVLYFIVIFLLSLANFTMWLTGPSKPTVELFTPLIRAMLSVLCSRLMLNIRSTASDKNLRPMGGQQAIAGLSKASGSLANGNSGIWFDPSKNKTTEHLGSTGFAFSHGTPNQSPLTPTAPYPSRVFDIELPRSKVNTLSAVSESSQFFPINVPGTNKDEEDMMLSPVTLAPSSYSDAGEIPIFPPPPASFPLLVNVASYPASPASTELSGRPGLLALRPPPLTRTNEWKLKPKGSFTIDPGTIRPIELTPDGRI